MSRLRYDDVELQMVRTLYLNQRAVYTEDGADYLCTHFKLAVVGVFNPAAPVDVVRGERAAETIARVRHALLQPRKVLLYTMNDTGPPGGIGDKILLQSPMTRALTGELFPADAKNGPKPIDANVVEVSGDKTFLVQWRVETWLNECQSAVNQERTVLSNRWSEMADTDELHYTTRVVRGRAYFRTDTLIAQGIVPDDFRRAFSHPIPQNFQRVRVRVTAQEDGSALDYEFIDQEQPTPLGPGSPAKRIEGYARGVFKGILPPLLYSVAAQLQVKVWGSRFDTKRQLRNIAVQIAVNKLSQLGAPVGGFNVVPIASSSMLVDLRHRFVQLDLEVWPANPALNVASPDIPGRFGNSPTTFNRILNFNDTLDTGVPGSNQPNGENPPFPISNKSRGAWTGALVTQLLTAECSPPSDPPETDRPAVDLDVNGNVAG